MIKTATRLALVALAANLVGCMPSEEDFDMMPQRPAGLDQLDQFIGTWEGEMEMHAEGMDAPMTSTGVFTNKWANDNWIMVGHGTMSMEGNENPMMEVWTWDESIKKFRTSGYYGSMTGESLAWYDADDGLWRMKGGGRNLITGYVTKGKGTMKMTDPDTMEWTWTEYDTTGLIKLMEMKGTHRRK